MRILFVLRADHERHFGGDLVQTRRIASFAESLGHDVTLHGGLPDDLAPFDLVHLFNLNLPLELFRHARRLVRERKPYLLAPVYWDMRGLWDGPAGGAAAAPPPGWKQRLKRALPPSAVEAIQRVRDFRRDPAPARRPMLWRSYDGMRRYALRHARALIVNSRAEADHLLDRFPDTPRDAVRVVYNGCDPVASFDPDGFARAFPELAARRYAVCVAHLGPRKNQLRLVEAVGGLPPDLALDLILIGEENQNEENYLERVRAAAGPGVHFLGRQPHEVGLACMAGAVCHALPSHIETPGLASLEAAMVGCVPVVGDCAPVREYFGDTALYCDPMSVGSIRDAVAAAARGSHPRPDGAALRARFAWAAVLEPYRDLFDGTAASLRH